LRALSIPFAYFLVNQIQTFPPEVAALYLKIRWKSIQEKSDRWQCLLGLLGSNRVEL
jgi:hypothetical protein